MDAQDVLVSDVRVTALAPEGPYNFDWVDDNKIELADDCQYDSVPQNVANAIRQKNIQIVDDDLESGSQQNNTKNNNSELLTSSTEESSSELENLSDNSITEESNISGDDSEYISFVVRMGDPSERQEVIEKLQKFNVEASKKLQLSGPYKVIYEVKEDSLELVGMEDMGIGSEHGFTDI